MSWLDRFTGRFKFAPASVMKDSGLDRASIGSITLAGANLNLPVKRSSQLTGRPPRPANGRT